MKNTDKYSGHSIETVIDRLPTAEVLAEKDGVYTVSVEVYGNGIDMWVRSQGEYVKKIRKSKNGWKLCVECWSKF